MPFPLCSSLALTKASSELCMVVETMFSYAYMYRLHGTNNYADMTERATFNALPGGITADCKRKQHLMTREH